MKRVVLGLFMALLSLCSFANNELLSVIRLDGSGNAYLDYAPAGFSATPCSEINFRCEFTIPSGYSSVKQFEWYINGVLVKTTTSVSSDPWGVFGGAPLKMTSQNNDVVCKVIYQNSSGSSGPYASPVYTVGTDILGFSLNGPGTVNVGNQTVNYSLTPSGGLGTYNPPSGTYSVNWTGPSAWTVTPAGTNASFAADQGSGGTVKATVTLNGCGFSQDFTKNVTRTFPAPGYATANPATVCGSSPSGTFSINAVPLAVSYTYTIQLSYGNGVGVAFTSNGLQTITTSATSVAIDFNTSDDHIVFLNVVANYASGTSAPGSLQIIYNATISWPGSTITFTPSCIPYCGPGSSSFFQATAPWIQGATYYWYVDGFLSDVTAGNNTYLDYHGESGLSVRAVTACASTGYISDNIPAGCGCSPARSGDNALTVTPNPAQGEISVNLKTSGKEKTQPKTIREIRVLDKFGNLKKHAKYPSGTQSVKLNIGDLPADVYIIEVFDGVNKISKQLSKVK